MPDIYVSPEDKAKAIRYFLSAEQAQLLINEIYETQALRPGVMPGLPPKSWQLIYWEAVERELNKLKNE